MAWSLRRHYLLLVGQHAYHWYASSPPSPGEDQLLISPIVVLGTIKAATDVLEKRGNVYSSRPRNILGLAAILITHSVV